MQVLVVENQVKMQNKKYYKQWKVKKENSLKC